MKGKTCIVTGSNSGIGKETAKTLADMEATVVMVVRNQDRGEKAKKQIIDETGNHSTSLMICDLSSMDSIRQFTEEFKDRFDRLDVLINNAGAVFSKRQITIDGFEETLTVNYLGPFLLTYDLLPLLKSSAPSRVINLSSGAIRRSGVHGLGRLDFNDFMSEKNYSGMKVYGKAKIMIIMFTQELTRRLEGTGVTANTVLPGFVATNLGRNSGGRLNSIMFTLMRPFQLSAKKGSETSVYLASSEEVERVTGKIFSKQKDVTKDFILEDQDTQKLLWNKTLDLLGINSLSQNQNT